MKYVVHRSGVCFQPGFSVSRHEDLGRDQGDETGRGTQGTRQDAGAVERRALSKLHTDRRARLIGKVKEKGAVDSEAATSWAAR